MTEPESKASPRPWRAGRTDMQSYLDDGRAVHYVYRGKTETPETRIRILELPDSGIDPTDDALFIVEAVNAYDGLRGENERLRTALKNLANALFELTNQSGGVYGLHLNGDHASWDELLPGGRYEDWLLPLRDADELLKERP